MKNNTFLSHRKFQCHKEYSVGFFANVNTKVTIRENTREHIQEHLIFIDIDDDDIKDLTEKCINKMEHEKEKKDYFFQHLIYTEN